MSESAQGRTYLFSYGTLRQREVQLSTFGRELDGTPDLLPGYTVTTVEITDPDVIAVSGTARHPIVRATGDLSHAVEGTVFAITDAELAAADDYEVADYRRVFVRLASGVLAWVYIDS
ncbi:gamma-glutamylcyclotransferase [Streptosporangium sp. NBC_01755]|uniref:gamma-glutamylcyclotransferase family protein n=1 Tax=unclassified Streptosporangium TaxID=2632669 RepID=UPI002DD9FCC5|nr:MULTISPECIES: gamma-glutamylcyclotransferase family protein [unclassified Streptosporangium]WSA27811.1 gamma-glutamylcyclotransferase [Streptosporangium sp. NBC_01810]WSD00714.1 gamma-glutamylcyclotransferase [Streptosporangium sp. NBC_01755]